MLDKHKMDRLEQRLEKRGIRADDDERLNSYPIEVVRPDMVPMRNAAASKRQRLSRKEINKRFERARFI